MQRDAFQAIADPTRREIIDLLAHEPLSVNQVAEKFEISRPAISKHLRILREAGLVSIRKEGRRRIYSAELRALKEVAEWAMEHRSAWTQRLSTLEILMSDYTS